jgi:hypothetical protein
MSHIVSVIRDSAGFWVVGQTGGICYFSLDKEKCEDFAAGMRCANKLFVEDLVKILETMK